MVKGKFIQTLQWVYLSSLGVNGKGEFIPTLQWVYLSSLSVNGKKSCGGVEALLLAAYNLDIVSSDGKPKIKTFRIPSFGQPSVYHEPSALSSLSLSESALSIYLIYCSLQLSAVYPCQKVLYLYIYYIVAFSSQQFIPPSALSSLSLSESALSRYDHTEPEIWRSGPYPQYEAINGQNRQSILSYLLQCYNSCISDLSELSHQMYCKACSRLATTGFDDLSDISCTVKPSASFHLQDSPPPQSKRKSHVGELLPRIAISPTLMTEMVSGLYYIMFNSDKYLATRAILDIHNRAS
ncbi:FAM126 [Mytilus edulis]|uniref:FAM126 n=1 Tax=Mytilus edulis TaxID=6550 RepID=A0A8S3U5U8_MYTED|nr:FAM126 [Mytilus edulis]